MKKKLKLFLLIILSISFFSSNYTINPQNPYAGQIITINIELYKYGIFDVNLSKSFVKTNDAYINIISYKINKKNNKYFLRINLQVFKVGKISLKDIIFFDGYSYYNFETIAFTTNSKIKEYYILPNLLKLKKIVSLQFVMAYLFFMGFVFVLFITFSKLRIFLIKYFARMKELSIIKNKLKIIFNLQTLLLNNNIDEKEYKKNLINFTTIINEILNLGINFDDKDEVRNNLIIRNEILVKNSYKSEKELIQIKKSILYEVNEIVNLIKYIMNIKYGKIKI